MSTCHYVSVNYQCCTARYEHCGVFYRQVILEKELRLQREQMKREEQEDRKREEEKRRIVEVS